MSFEAHDIPFFEAGRIVDKRRKVRKARWKRVLYFGGPLLSNELVRRLRQQTFGFGDELSTTALEKAGAPPVEEANHAIKTPMRPRSLRKLRLGSGLRFAILCRSPLLDCLNDLGASALESQKWQA